MNNSSKKMLSVLFAVLMLLAALCVGNALAANSGNCGESLTWTLDDSGTLTISGTGEMFDEPLLSSPESETVKAVIIEDGVTSIGDPAFLGFSSVTSVTIPKSVTKIGGSAFIGCSAVTDFTVDEGNPAYSSANGVLFNKDKTTLVMYPAAKEGEFSVPDSVAAIDFFALLNCRGLTGVSVSEGNTTYSSLNGVLFSKDKTTLVMYPFGKADDTYTVPDGVKSIANFAFGGNEKLSGVTIPGSVEAIEDSAFSGCTGLKDVTIFEGVKTIGHDAFYRCTSLESITLPNSTTKTGENVFDSCTSLKNVTLSEGLTRIEKNLFSGCTSLESFLVPKNITEIGVDIFDKCTALKSITVDENNVAFSSADGVLFNKDKTALIIYPIGKSDKTYVIPNGVTKIKASAFFRCENLTGVIFPDGVAEIERYAFTYCKNLTGVTFPNGLKEINERAFAECEKLERVTFSSTVESIGHGSFASCVSLNNVVIPAGVKAVYANAFSNCRNLTNVIVKGSETTIGDKAFGYYVDPETDLSVKISGFTLYCPNDSAAASYARRNSLAFAEHVHSFEMKVTKAAACTVDGESTHTCLCGESYTQKIPALGHTEVETPAVAATCTKDGKTAETKCSVCGEVIKASKTVKATGHKFKTTTVKATLKKNGSAETKCTVCKAVKSKSTIYKVSSVKLSKTALTYNGKVQKPTVVIKDSKGKKLKSKTDYTVKYSSGCKNVGRYTVTITFKGKYSGTKTLTFEILPKGTSVSKLTAGKKQLTAKWSKQTSQTTGYELQYSTKSNMSKAKTVSVGKNKTTSSTVKKLKSNTKYYVRVRTYKTVKINGKSVKLYSAWSKVKSVRVK